MASFSETKHKKNDFKFPKTIESIIVAKTKNFAKQEINVNNKIEEKNYRRNEISQDWNRSVYFVFCFFFLLKAKRYDDKSKEKKNRKKRFFVRTRKQ